ncbi:MAG: hypothetical protein WA790_14200 [Sulfitobacter sp.]
MAEEVDRFANKDEVELQKVFMELPKAGLTIVAFFATACALILRVTVDESSQISLLFRVLYLTGIVVTVLMFLKSYNYISQVVNNVSSPCKDCDRVDQITKLKDELYPKLKFWISTAVILWIIILCVFVLFL